MHLTSPILPPPTWTIRPQPDAPGSHLQDTGEETDVQHMGSENLVKGRPGGPTGVSQCQRLGTAPGGLWGQY